MDHDITSDNVPATICSSLIEDRWHAIVTPGAFECWHFDALSDNGREAVIINFYDNYIFSPRYHDQIIGKQDALRCPAVSFLYSVNGRAVLSAVNEFDCERFTGNCERAEAKFGDSSFSLETAEYGSGYLTRLELNSLRGQRITAEMEWLSIEADLLDQPSNHSSEIWNIAAPRGDVSGRISLIGRDGSTRRVIHFRGTGYHDSFKSRLGGKNNGARYWGRAHFLDRTVIFELRGSSGILDAKIYTVKDDIIEQETCEIISRESRIDRFGMRVPKLVRIKGQRSGEIVTIITRSNIRSDVSRVKLSCDVELITTEKIKLQAMGLSEFIDPDRMRRVVIRKLADLRIGRNGRSPIL